MLYRRSGGKFARVIRRLSKQIAQERESHRRGVGRIAGRSGGRWDWKE